MNMESILQKTVKEIEDEIVILKREMLNLRFQRATGELSNPSRFKVARRMIARYKTALAQKNKIILEKSDA